MPAPDMTDKYNTKLSSGDEAKFQGWLKQSGRTGDLRDYDMRGWWKNDKTQAANGHFSDEYKKPNHPTFSDESKYNGVDGNSGGHWGGTDDAPSFTPSKSNLKNLNADEMQDYFKRVEPTSELKLPASAADKRYGSQPQ